MDDRQENNQQQIAELKAEVRRLKYIVRGMLAVSGVAGACIFPQVALAAFVIGAYILIALLISPVRHLIFPSVFQPRPIVNRQSQI
jgi:hypothetical protein